MIVMRTTAFLPGLSSAIAQRRPATKDEILAAIDEVHSRLVEIRTMAEELLSCEVRDIGSDGFGGGRAEAPPADG